MKITNIKTMSVITSVLLSMPLIAQEADIKLESTFVGDKEQPAVSYFIPWKGIGTPDKLQWNLDNKHDNTLDLADRDVLVRSMSIYNEMNLEARSEAK